MADEYNVEFDDALLDLAGWKNPRYNGSKLTGKRINQFNQGDTSYGLNPVVENKTACIFLGKDIDEGSAVDRSSPLTEILNHSYLTIDKILFIDLETDEVEIITRENMSIISFNRIITENFKEGSSLIIKSLENVPNKLKSKHYVKFNRGQLMKVYSYTANQEGVEDGVFGGFGVRERKGEYIDNLGKDDIYSGLFGFGQTTSSLYNPTTDVLEPNTNIFNTQSIQFTTLLPSELSLYESNYSTDIIATVLSPITASIEQSFQPGNIIQSPNQNDDEPFGKSIQ